MTIALPEKFAHRTALSAAEVAELLGIDRATYYRRIYPAVQSRQIASMTIGSRRLVIITSLLAWLARQVEQSL